MTSNYFWCVDTQSTHIPAQSAIVRAPTRAELKAAQDLGLADRCPDLESVQRDAVVIDRETGRKVFQRYSEDLLPGEWSNARSAALFREGSWIPVVGPVCNAVTACVKSAQAMVERLCQGDLEGAGKSVLSGVKHVALAAATQAAQLGAFLGVAQFASTDSVGGLLVGYLACMTGYLAWAASLRVASDVFAASDERDVERQRMIQNIELPGPRSLPQPPSVVSGA